MKGIAQNKVSYENAINSIAEYLYHNKSGNIFDASVIIANIYDVHKTIVMDDLIESRRNYTEICKK